MINKVKNFFKRNQNNKSKDGGFSDFFTNASDKVKREIIIEAARKANEDQLKVFNKFNTRSYSN